MVTLDLSKVDRKAQGPLELDSYFFSFGPTPNYTLKPILERPKRPTQLDNQLDIKEETYIILYIIHYCEMMCMCE